MSVSQRIAREQQRRAVANRLAREAYVDKLYTKGWDGDAPLMRPDDDGGAIFDLVVFCLAASAWALGMLGLNWLVG